MTSNKQNALATLTDGDVDVINALEWRDIVNDLVEDLVGGDEYIPERVIRATELMLSGLPNYQVAKEMGVETATVKAWLTKYPKVANVVRQGRNLLGKWRMARLEQQFITAIEKSDEILKLDIYEHEEDDARPKVNAKLVATQAQHARFIIDQFTKQINDISVQSDGEKVTMSASADAMAYLARELSKNRERNEPIEATYRVIDSSNSAHQPVLDAEGNPFYGEMGKLDKDINGTLCHICGKRYKKFSLHLSTVHVVPNDIYELTFMLPEGSIHDD